MDWEVTKFFLRDLWAQIRTKPALAMGKEYHNSPPYFINIEPTCFCNLDCTICSYDGSRKKGYISRETVIKVLDQAQALGVREVRLFLAGEPFFHPRLHEFINETTKRGMQSLVHTNATFMPDDRIKAALDAGLTKISFSFDGESAKEYEKVRIGGNFERALQNIINFLQIKKAKGSRFPITTIQVIKLPDSPNPNRITGEFKSRFRGLPVDEFLLLKPFVWPDQDDQEFNIPPGSKYFPCMIPWTSLSVAWDGRVLWCCGDLNGKGELGDVNHSTLKEIWNNDSIRKIRRDLSKGDLKDLDLCRNCEALYHRHHPVLSDLKEYYRQLKRALK